MRKKKKHYKIGFSCYGCCVFVIIDCGLYNVRGKKVAGLKSVLTSKRGKLETSVEAENYDEVRVLLGVLKGVYEKIKILHDSIIDKLETEDEIVVDGNHPLAGIALNFDVEILQVRQATEEEIAHGHAHGPSGEHHH